MQKGNACSFNSISSGKFFQLYVNDCGQLIVRKRLEIFVNKMKCEVFLTFYAV